MIFKYLNAMLIKHYWMHGETEAGIVGWDDETVLNTEHCGMRNRNLLPNINVDGRTDIERLYLMFRP